MPTPIAVIVKIVTGIIVVPMAAFVHYLWPYWENKQNPFPLRVLLGIVLLPLAGILAVVFPWWDDIYKV